LVKCTFGKGGPIGSCSPDSLAHGLKRPRWSVTVGWCLWLVIIGCVAESKDAAKRDVIGPYKTWDDVISRWIGGRTSDLYVELGPPNLHPHELDNRMTEMVWDFGIDRMPGQADVYDLLPLYGENVNCQIHFFADAKGIITKGEKVGCE
jgi:hypothetical protein